MSKVLTRQLAVGESIVIGDGIIVSLTARTGRRAGLRLEVPGDMVVEHRPCAANEPKWATPQKPERAKSQGS